MKITIDLESRALTATREDGDRYYSGESHLLHGIKQKLFRMGYDVIKKRMWKDGHLVNDDQQYIRSRLTSDKRSFAVYDHQFAIRDLAEDWRKEGEVTLLIVGVENFKPTLPNPEEAA